MKMWFTSDTHYHHKNIIKYCNRPFETVEQMNDVLIEEYNKVVGPDDIVYHLGDFSFCPSSEVENILSQLNGRKTLIHGNHDDRRVTGASGWYETCSSLLIDLGGVSIRLHHYPKGRDKYTETFYLHGHTHNTIPPTSSSLDVGVDSAHHILGVYRPFSLIEVADIMEKYALDDY